MLPLKLHTPFLVVEIPLNVSTDKFYWKSRVLFLKNAQYLDQGNIFSGNRNLKEKQATLNELRHKKSQQRGEKREEVGKLNTVYTSSPRNQVISESKYITLC